MHHAKIFLLLVVSLLLTACSGMRTGSAKATLDSSNTVAVASLLGQTFHGVHVGTTVFGNTSYEAPVPEWNIDAMTEQKVIAHLAQTASRKAIALQRDSELRSRLEKANSFFTGTDYQEVANLAKQQGADTVILIQPVRYDNAPFHKPGYGFFERTFFGASQRCIYSLFIVSVISTASGKQAGWEWGFPCEFGEKELEWKEGLDKYSEKELQLLRRKTEEAVEQNVRKALKGLGY